MFQKDLIVWKQILDNHCPVTTLEFQKDLIVWKLRETTQVGWGEESFQKDLIVWKPDTNGISRIAVPGFRRT